MVAPKNSKQPAPGFLSHCVKASELAGQPISVLLYGDPGAGKTHLAATSKEPIVLLTEANGRDTIRRSNPDALVFVADTAEAVRSFMRAGLSGEFAAAGRKTVVIDSLTEVQRLFADEIMSSKPKDNRRMELQDWGLLTTRMRGFCRTVRSMPLDVVATCLAEHTVEDDRGVIWTKPAFQGKKLAAEVAQYFNAVGFAYKRDRPAGAKEEDVQRTDLHAVDFDPGRRVLSKSHGPLSGVISGRTLSDLQTDIHQ